MPGTAGYDFAMLLRHLSLLIAIAAATLIAVPSAQAATYAVNTTADAADLLPSDGICKTAANTCSLRAAVQTANAVSGADTVTVPAGTYVLASGLAVTNSITITGAGARQTVVDGPSNMEAIKFTGGSSTMRGLAVANSGVGVIVQDAEALLDQIAVRDNSPGFSNGAGAGLYIQGVGADVELRRSSVTGNRILQDTTDAYGAGISVQGGKLTAVASTVADNAIGGSTSATRSNNAFGGGIEVSSGSAALRHVTLSGNTVTSDSSARYGANIYSNNNPVTIEDSLIAGDNSPGTPPSCMFAGAAKPVLAGRNLDSGITCGFGAGHLNSVDPLVRALGAFGGETDTTPVQVGSPAIDAAGACEPGGDQRGAPAAGAACDIGAAELSTDVAVTVQSSRASVAAGGDVTHVLTVSNAGPDTATGVGLDLSAPGGQVTVATPSTGTCTVAVHCDLGTLTPGSTATVTVVVQAGTGTPLLSTAHATAATPDSNSANDSVTASTTVTGGSAGGDKVAPVLGALKLSGKAKTKKAITVTGTLSEASTVTWKLDRLTAGRTSGKKCKTGLRKGKRCTIVKKLGSKSAAAAAGKLKLVIPAKFPKKAIPAGTYRLTVTAKDAAGNTSKARTLTLKIKR